MLDKIFQRDFVNDDGMKEFPNMKQYCIHDTIAFPDIRVSRVCYKSIWSNL